MKRNELLEWVCTEVYKDNEPKHTSDFNVTILDTTTLNLLKAYKRLWDSLPSPLNRIHHRITYVTLGSIILDKFREKNSIEDIYVYNGLNVKIKGNTVRFYGDTWNIVKEDSNTLKYKIDLLTYSHSCYYDLYNHTYKYLTNKGFNVNKFKVHGFEKYRFKDNIDTLDLRDGEFKDIDTNSNYLVKVYVEDYVEDKSKKTIFLDDNDRPTFKHTKVPVRNYKVYKDLKETQGKGLFDTVFNFVDIVEETRGYKGVLTANTLLFEANSNLYLEDIKTHKVKSLGDFKILGIKDKVAYITYSKGLVYSIDLNAPTDKLIFQGVSV